MDEVLHIELRTIDESHRLCELRRQTAERRIRELERDNRILRDRCAELEARHAMARLRRGIARAFGLAR